MTLRTVTFTLNGEHRTGMVEARRLLSDFLRDDLGLTGTHVGCEQGVCGACTILMDGRAIRSCLAFAVQADGSNLTTIEGIRGEEDQLHPVQQALHENHGLQCGFCTPGVVISACALLADNPNPSHQAVREGMSGNLCRCTGYQTIIQSIEEAAKRMALSLANREEIQ